MNYLTTYTPPALPDTPKSRIQYFLTARNERKNLLDVAQCLVKELAEKDLADERKSNRRAWLYVEILQERMQERLGLKHGDGI